MVLKCPLKLRANITVEYWKFSFPESSFWRSEMASTRLSALNLLVCHICNQTLWYLHTLIAMSFIAIISSVNLIVVCFVIVQVRQ